MSHAIQPKLRQDAGFSLVEMTFVMVILGFLLQGWFKIQNDWIEKLVIERTISGFAILDEAIYAHRVKTGVWTTDFESLAPWLPGAKFANGWGQEYILTIAANRETIIVSTRLENKAQQLAVAAAFPTNGHAVEGDGFVVSVAIPIPGLESAHAALLHKSGGSSQAMQGDLHLGGHNIKNAGEGFFSGLRFRNVAAVGDRCAAGQVSRTTEGDLLTCDNTVMPKIFKAVGSGAEGKIERGKTHPTALITKVRPPAGYNFKDCAISVNGPPLVLDGGDERQNFSWHIEYKTGRSEWWIRALASRNTEARGFLNAEVVRPKSSNKRAIWEVSCLKNAGGPPVSTLPPPPLPPDVILPPGFLPGEGIQFP